MNAFLKIPIDRLKAGQPVSGDVYLDMPRNGKQIKILNAGESFDEESLARYRERGCLDLLISPSTPGEYEAQTFPVHQSDPGPAGIAQAASGSEGAYALKESGAEIPQQKIVKAAASSDADSATVPASAPEAEEHTRVGGQDPVSEEAVSLSGESNVAAEPEQSFLVDALKEDSTRIGGNEEPKRESSVKVSAGNDTKEEELFVVQGGSSPGSKKTQELAQEPSPDSLSLTDEKTLELIRRQKQQQLRNAMARLDDDLPPELSDSEILSENPNLESYSATEEVQGPQALKERLEAQLQQIQDGSKNLALKKRQDVQRLKNALASIEAGLPPAEEDLLVMKDHNPLAEDQENVAFFSSGNTDQLESDSPMVLKQRIEQTIEALESPVNARAEELRGQQSAQRIRNALARLEEGLPPAGDLGDLLGESEEFAAPEVLMADLPELAALDSDPADEPAVALLKDKSNAPRDLRSIISSLAVQLAQSLGYTDARFLSDLAVTALLYFAKLEGKEPKDDSLVPELARCIFSENAPSGIAAGDTKQILFLLEKYLADPDCDRKRKDLSTPLLQKLEKNFFDGEPGTTESAIDPWNMARWQQFAKKGTNLDMMTVCSQASTSALKLARNLT